jgi:hypothetical protein
MLAGTVIVAVGLSSGFNSALSLGFGIEFIYNILNFPNPFLFV